MNRFRLGSTLLCALLVSVNIAWAQQPATIAPKAKVVPAIAQNKDTQAAITPAIALQMLKDGNARFTGDKMMPCLTTARRATARITLSCKKSPT